MLRFQVLGLLRVTRGTLPVAIPRGNLSVLLAGLVLHANDAVADEKLIDWLWPDDLPAQPRRALRVCVARLRAVLGDPESGRLQTCAGGYRLLGSAEDVDLLRVRSLLERAAAASGDPATQADLLAAALGQWDNPVLPEIRSDPLRRDAIDGLDQSWVTVVQTRIDAELALGRHAELLTELSTLVPAYPLHEPFRAQLMTVLYRCDRRADALAEFDRARRYLLDQLGAGPGPALRDLHRRMLEDDPGLCPPPTAEPAVPAHRRPAAPAQLPADLDSFTGRGPELDRLTASLDDGGSGVRVGVIDGMAGVGKTALVLHLAHRLAGRYPDGHLFLDLHGFSDGPPPVAPAEALNRMLLALGTPGGRIPPELDDRAALFRSRLAATRTLIVLDDAATEQQVRPLLPAAAGCLVLVTSRRRLSGLEDARALSLDILPPDDAVELFLRAAGTDRVTAAADDAVMGDVTAVVELCGRLPLAIRIAAARLRSRPQWSTSYLLQRLRGHRDRPAGLGTGPGSVTAALELSFRQLSARSLRFCALLSLHPGAQFGADSAQALGGLNEEATMDELDELVDSHLLTEPAAGRYRFHDLVRAHAADRATRLSAEDRGSARDRLGDFYADMSAAAVDLLYPFEAEQRPALSPGAECLRAGGTPAQARRWLDAEMDTLLADGPDDARRVGHRSATLHRHLRVRADFDRAEALHRRALDAARDRGDGGAEALALIRLGDVHRFRGRWDAAAACFEQARQLARQGGHRPGELLALTGSGWAGAMRYQYPAATAAFEQALLIAGERSHRSGETEALLGLGNTALLAGDYAGAGRYFARAQRAAAAIGHRIAEQTALPGLGWVDGMQGRHENAAARYRGALRLIAETGDRSGEIQALTGLGHALRATADLAGSAQCHERVLALAGRAGDRTGELAALVGLGQVHTAWDQPGPAEECFGRALVLAESAGDDNWRFEALYGLGTLARAAGRTGEALDRHRRALGLAIGLGHRADEARANDGLARDYRASGNLPSARRHWLRTLDLLTQLGTDDLFDEQVTATAVREDLDDLDRRTRASAAGGHGRAADGTG